MQHRHCRRAVCGGDRAGTRFGILRRREFGRLRTYQYGPWSFGLVDPDKLGGITSADGLSRTDGLYHGPTFAVGSFGPLATGTVPSSGTLTFQHVVISSDLSNGIAIDPENNDSVVVGCGPAPTITASGVSPNTGSTSGGTSVTITGTGGASCYIDRAGATKFIQKKRSDWTLDRIVPRRIFRS